MKIASLSPLLVSLALFGVPLMAAAESYNDVAVIDVNCSQKAAANPNAHTRDCALKCAGSGFGILTKDQQFLKFDAAGNAKIVDALKASSKKDHLRVDVNGQLQGDTLKVTSIKLL